MIMPQKLHTQCDNSVDVLVFPWKAAIEAQQTGMIHLHCVRAVTNQWKNVQKEHNVRWAENSHKAFLPLQEVTQLGHLILCDSVTLCLVYLAKTLDFIEFLFFFYSLQTFLCMISAPYVVIFYKYTNSHSHISLTDICSGKVTWSHSFSEKAIL